MLQKEQTLNSCANLEATFYTKFEKIESWKNLSQILEMKFQWIKLSKCWWSLEVQFQQIGHDKAKLGQKFENITLEF